MLRFEHALSPTDGHVVIGHCRCLIGLIHWIRLPVFPEVQAACLNSWAKEFFLKSLRNITRRVPPLQTWFCHMFKIMLCHWSSCPAVLLFFYQHWLVLQKAQGMLPHKGLDFEAITPGDFRLLLKYQPPEIWTQLLEELGSDGFELKGDQFSKPRSCILYSSDSSTGMQEKLCGHCASLSKKETKNDSIPKLPRTVRPHMLSPNSFLLHPVPCEWTGKFFYRSLQLQNLGGKQSNFEEKLWPAEH